MIWLVLALLVALLAIVLGVCALFAWREPVRRGAQVIDLTGARAKPGGGYAKSYSGPRKERKR